MIETLCFFDNVSSFRDSETVSIDATENESEIKVWTQRMADKTNGEFSELRSEMNEKLKKMTTEKKNIKMRKG